MATLGLAPPHFVGLDASRPGPRPRNPQTAPDSGAVFLCPEAGGRVRGRAAVVSGERSALCRRVLTSRRTLLAFFVLPQVLLSPPKNDFARFRSFAGRTGRLAVACGQGPSGRYAPSGLSFPLRYACGPLPLTRPRTATPAAGPCPSGSMASRAVSRSLRPIARDARNTVSCKLADNNLHLRKEEKEMISALFIIVSCLLSFSVGVDGRVKDGSEACSRK